LYGDGSHRVAHGRALNSPSKRGTSIAPRPVA
jgi:hypothetical protein